MASARPDGARLVGAHGVRPPLSSDHGPCARRAPRSRNDPPEQCRFSISPVRFQKGSPEQAYAALDSERALVANGILASQLGWQVGDTVSLVTPTGEHLYRVVGIGGDYLNAEIATIYISQANLGADYQRTGDV